MEIINAMYRYHSGMFCNLCIFTVKSNCSWHAFVGITGRELVNYVVHLVIALLKCFKYVAILSYCTCMTRSFSYIYTL